MGGVGQLGWKVPERLWWACLRSHACPNQRTLMSQDSLPYSDRSVLKCSTLSEAFQGYPIYNLLLIASPPISLSSYLALFFPQHFLPPNICFWFVKFIVWLLPLWCQLREARIMVCVVDYYSPVSTTVPGTQGLNEHLLMEWTNECSWLLTSPHQAIILPLGKDFHNLSWQNAEPSSVPDT